MECRRGARTTNQPVDECIHGNKIRETYGVKAWVCNERFPKDTENARMEEPSMVSTLWRSKKKNFFFRLDEFWFGGLFGLVVSCIFKGLLQPGPKLGCVYMGAHLCLPPCLRQGLFVCFFTGQDSWLTGLPGSDPASQRHRLTCLDCMVFQVKWWATHSATFLAPKLNFFKMP